MPAPISKYVADQLGITESRAQQLLHAMFGEIKKRAAAGSGVRVPELGTFRYVDGELTFAPSPSLSRAVNQRYEGLDAESLSDFDLTLQTEHYSTGETGIWSPFRSNVEPAEAVEAESIESQASSGASSAYDDLPDPEPAPPAADAHPTSAPEHRSIWDMDLDDEVGGDASGVRPHPTDHVSEQLDDAEVDVEKPAEANVWDSDSSWDFSSVSSEDADEDTTTDDSLSDDADDPYAPGSFSAEDEEAYEEQEVYDAEEVDENVSTAENDDNQRRSRLPLVLGLLVLVAALGAGVWYILDGSTGTTTADQTTTAPAGESADANPAGQDDASSSPAGESAGASTPDAAQAETAPSQSAPSRSNVSTRPIIPSEGGWTIVVGSYVERSEATPTMRSFIQQFESQGYPVDILTGTSNGTTRYRVAIGQFNSRDQALAVIERAGAQLPDGAWTMRIE